MMDFAAGDRVVLLSCSNGPAGTVTALSRGKVCVRFDDLEGATWVLRPSSLRMVGDVRSTTGIVKGTK
jgi:hypothetical protein